MKPLLACAAALALGVHGHAGAIGHAQEPPVLRVSVTTVRVDVVVTDRAGHQVTDLRPEDFEILQDGRVQSVSSFGFVPMAAGEAVASNALPAADASATPNAVTTATPPPGRLLVIVVDDLTLSPTSILRTREELTRIVDGQLTPADRVTLIRTSGGGGRLLPFTTDKTVLRQHVDALRFNSRQFERDDYKVTAENERLREWPPFRNPSTDPRPPEADVDPKLAASANEESRTADNTFSAGVLGTLQGVVSGLRAMPGRKGILLFSDGFTLSGASGGSVHPMLQQTLHRLVDHAMRAHAVIYAVNVRPWESTTGAEMDLGGSPFRNSVEGATQAKRVDALRTAAFGQLAEGPAYLASQTGGLFFRNPSDLAAALRRSLDDQRGYYLLGYAPDTKTTDQDRRSRTFHELEVRVRGRSGLVVRSRKGFLGGPDSGPEAAGTTLMSAAASPFSASTLDLRLTGFFAGRDAGQSIVRALVYVDGAALEFQRSRSGSAPETFLEFVTLLVDQHGAVIKRDQQSYRVRGGDQSQTAGGFVHQLDVLVKAPGPYSLKVAAREVASHKIGSASQFVVVPDLSRKRLTLSGVLVSGGEPAAGVASSLAEPAHPAVRRFKTPAVVGYAFQIYNARYEKGSRRPALRAQVRLLRDERVVYTGPLVEVPTTAAQGAPVSAIGSLSLGPQTKAGGYVLSVTVVDTLAPNDQAEATSTIDFTIES